MTLMANDPVYYDPYDVDINADPLPHVSAPAR